MEIKESYVAKKNLTDMFKIIEQTLSENQNTQVFIDNEIYENLKGMNDENYHVSSPNFSKTWHYNRDSDNFGGENWLVLTENGHAYYGEIYAASFIHNCTGYYQLVEFISYKSENYPKNNYTHFLAGFEQLLLIHFKK